MKNASPAEKPAKRYLKVRIHAEEKIGIGDLVNAVWDSAISYIGTRDLSNAEPWIIANKFDKKSQEGIIKVNKDYEEELRASLALIRSLGNKKGFIEVKKVSGSLRSVS